ESQRQFGRIAVNRILVEVAYLGAAVSALVTAMVLAKKATRWRIALLLLLAAIFASDAMTWNLVRERLEEAKAAGKQIGVPLLCEVLDFGGVAAALCAVGLAGNERADPKNSYSAFLASMVIYFLCCLVYWLPLWVFGGAGLVVGGGPPR